MTSQEAWSGEKPTVSYLRVFGCVTYTQSRRLKEKNLMIAEQSADGSINRYKARLVAKRYK
jgi:hypothetical protein